MKPTVTKVKNARGHITCFRASYFGLIEVEGKSPAGAIATAENELRCAVARLDQGARILQWRGRVAVIVPDTQGWRYWVDGFSRADYFVRVDEREAAEVGALMSMAQHYWDHNVDDAELLADVDTRIRDELKSWIAWQRRYAAARVVGLSDVDAHRAACEGRYTDRPAANYAPSKGPIGPGLNAPFDV